MTSFDITVMGGLPVTIACCGATGWEVTHIAGRKLKANEVPDWIYKRLSANDIDVILDKCECDARDHDLNVRLDAAAAKSDRV